MKIKSLGFIGAGRVTKIILTGLKRKSKLPGHIIVSDVNSERLNRLKNEFPEIDISLNNNSIPAEKDIVFLALHPPAISSVLLEISPFLQSTKFLISLAPKVSIKNIQENLEFLPKIVRMIPNACSIVNIGYNPVTFDNTVNEEEKKFLLNFLSDLGECPVVPEEKLEAYAVVTGMGPTYFWFQFNELKEIAKNFGLTEQESVKAIAGMGIGMIKTLFNSNLTEEQVMDLIPVKPLAEQEERIKETFRSALIPLYKKLKGIA